MTYVNKKYPLIIEQHPSSYTGYPFITLLLYGDEKVLTIIDNYDKHNIYAYVLDYCVIENIDENVIIKVAIEWYSSGRKCPLSIELSKRDIKDMHRIYRTFNINYVKRIIGTLPQYNLDIIQKIKRKKKKISDSTLDIVYNPASSIFDSSS